VGKEGKLGERRRRTRYLSASEAESSPIELRLTRPIIIYRQPISVKAGRAGDGFCSNETVDTSDARLR
jgi:hypothetical protein